MKQILIINWSDIVQIKKSSLEHQYILSYVQIIKIFGLKFYVNFLLLSHSPPYTSSVTINIFAKDQKV